MSTEYSLILFDLDGTLIDTSEGVYNGLDYMLEQMGEPPIDEKLKPNFVGPPLKVNYPLFFGFEGERLERAMKLYRKHGNEQGYKEFSHYPGMRELLKELKSRGLNTAVVTMKEENLAKKQMDEAGLTPLLSKIIGNVDANPYTKAELIDKAITDFGATTETTLLIGDTGVDAKGARDAGVDFYPAMYGFGFNFKDETEDYPYVKKLYAPQDLLTVLEGENNG